VRRFANPSAHASLVTHYGATSANYRATRRTDRPDRSLCPFGARAARKLSAWVGSTRAIVCGRRLVLEDCSEPPSGRYPMVSMSVTGATRWAMRSNGGARGVGRHRRPTVVWMPRSASQLSCSISSFDCRATVSRSNANMDVGSIRSSSCQPRRGGDEGRRATAAQATFPDEASPDGSSWTHFQGLPAPAVPRLATPMPPRNGHRQSGGRR
jgi:hypothetical protein